MTVEQTVPQDESKGEGAQEIEIPGVPSEMLRDVPPEVRRIIGGQLSMMMSGTVAHPIYNKITSEHIDKIIEETANQYNRETEERKDVRTHEFRIFICTLIVILVLTVFLSLQNQITVLYSLMLALLGIAGGYGLAHRKRE
ncbi:MAG: hypothetical protein HW403_1409 [Dehalococcoidia bacterium]|nr:hypothetical protein [Dehalococcoidia bacterium]